MGVLRMYSGTALPEEGSYEDTGCSDICSNFCGKEGRQNPWFKQYTLIGNAFNPNTWSTRPVWST